METPYGYVITFTVPTSGRAIYGYEPQVTGNDGKLLNAVANTIARSYEVQVTPMRRVYCRLYSLSNLPDLLQYHSMTWFFAGYTSRKGISLTLNCRVTDAYGNLVPGAQVIYSRR
jgi:hypothetical protein